MPKGLLVIISAPSGTGKSTICRKLLRRHSDLRYSTSCTTRPPRGGERLGHHYHFVDKEEFKRRIQRGEFLEWAVVHDHYYGTPRDFIDRTLAAGRSVLLDVDVQGAMAIRRKITDVLLIFIAPPTLGSLRSRLRSRRDGTEAIAKRLASSRAEIAAAKDYDYLVVNDDLKKAVAEISCILTAESLRVSRRQALDLESLTR